MLRRQIDDLLGVKALVTDQLAAALQRLGAHVNDEHRPEPGTGGRVKADASLLDRVVSGPVEVVVSPLVDFVGISTLERAFAAVPEIADVHVLRVDGDRAVVELELREAGPLLRWLDGALPFDVAVSAIGPAAVSLAVR